MLIQVGDSEVKFRLSSFALAVRFLPAPQTTYLRLCCLLKLDLLPHDLMLCLFRITEVCGLESVRSSRQVHGLQFLDCHLT